VGAGYHQRAELSAERFRALPDLCTGLVYLTGDLGRWDAQGQLQFLGRRDAQLKLRGVRVELGEIEHHLRTLPGVQDAVVTAPTDTRGETQLVAYVVSALQADAPQVTAWRSQLATSLPEAMLPAQFVVLAALPQTPNGKTDRRALPAPAPMQTPAGNDTPRDSASPAEQAIVQVFAEVLGAPIGPDEDFFVRGGDSLRAIRAVASLRRAGWLLDAQTLFLHASAATLATQLGQSASAKKAAVMEAVEASEVVKSASPPDDDAPTFSGLDSDEINSLFT
jgi:aryl carrier-like protein